MAMPFNIVAYSYAFSTHLKFINYIHNQDGYITMVNKFVTMVNTSVSMVNT